MDNNMYKVLLAQAEELVKKRILGNRKGIPDMPNYTHSLRVADLLKGYGFSEEIRLAGLLHDVIEDGGVSLDELADIGFPDDVIETVRLCTYDMNISNKDHRWVSMVIQLAKADSASAWAVKLADIFDNLKEANVLPVDREKLMREVKAPVLLSASKHLLGETQLWQDLAASIDGKGAVTEMQEKSPDDEQSWTDRTKKRLIALIPVAGKTPKELAQEVFRQFTGKQKSLHPTRENEIIDEIEDTTATETAFQMGFTNAPEWAVRNLPKPIPDSLDKTTVPIEEATAKPYVAFVLDEKTFTYHAHLMNPTDVSYSAVVSKNGANASDGDDVIQTINTERSIANKGPLSKQSSMFIEYGNEYDLDWEIWYHFDLYKEGEEKPWKVMFSIPKYGDNYKPEYLNDGMLVGLTGMRIELRERYGE